MSSPGSADLAANAVFIAQESFLVEEELSKRKLLLGDNASLNWAVFNVEENPSLDEIISLCNTMPFLSEQRVVVVHNAQKLLARQLEQIISYMADPNGSTTMILVMEVEKTDKELNRILKMFEGKAKILRFDALKNRAERISWITGRMARYAKVIEKDAATLLADLTGSGSMWYLDSEIQKLCLYVAASPAVTAADVQKVVMRTHEPAIFGFLDALFDRKKDALARLYELELAGVAELEIISRIANQIINHYVVLSGKDWKKMKIHEFVAEKAMKRKSLWKTEQLLDLLKDVRRIEQRIKSSSLVHVYAALTEVIGRHTIPARH